jgi:hypothetical protein
MKVHVVLSGRVLRCSVYAVHSFANCIMHSSWVFKSFTFPTFAQSMRKKNTKLSLDIYNL